MTKKKKKTYIECDYERLHTVKLAEEEEEHTDHLDTRIRCSYVTKTIDSGNVREVEVYPTYLKSEIPDNWRMEKHKKIQKNLNDKNARKNLIRLINTNFTNGDYLITLTYDNENLPEDHEEAKKNMQNFLRRLSYQIKKRDLEKAKYIYVTEHSKIKNKKSGEEEIRCHHHLIINSCLPIDFIESLWKFGRRNNMKKLSADESGLTGISNYLTKDPKGKKRWCCSKNLKKPIIRKSKSKFTKRRVDTMTKCQNLIKIEMERANPGYIFTDYEIYINKVNGRPYIYALMRKNN